jgi:type I restriction enzyme S subunit
LLEGLEISILNKSIALLNNETERIDSEYFKKEYLFKIQELKANNNKFLNELGLIKGGKRLPLGEDFSEVGIPYIRAQDVKNNFVEFENSPRISEKLHLELISYQTKYNDILITNVGNSIGDTGIVKFEMKKCNLTENAVKFISQKINPDFVFSFFQSKFGKFQIERETVGTAQPKLAIERIRKFIIPIVNDKLQEKISEIIKKALENKINSKKTYLDAETYLLSEIGLHNFELSKEAINIKNFKDSYVLTKRLDAEFYQIKYEQIIKKIITQKHAKLKSIVEISKSIEPGSNYYSHEEGLPFYRVADFNKFGLSKPDKELTNLFIKENKDLIERLKPKKGTILFSKDGSVGTAYLLRHDLDGITSGAILHLKIKNSNEIIPEYLTLALNSKLVQMQAERDSGGSIILHWRKEEIEQVVVPIIDFKKQKQIAKLVEESFKLKVESVRLLEIAKKAVEMAIEIDEASAIKLIKENT